MVVLIDTAIHVDNNELFETVEGVKRGHKCASHEAGDLDDDLANKACMV